MPNLITNILPINDLKSLYIETFLNHTNSVSKISDLSVLNAHAFAIAKLLQKDIKDTAILESQIFPQLASGIYLDNAAKLVGGETRLSLSNSSTYVLVIAEPGTIYISGDTTFISSKGVQFDMIETVYVGGNGYAYIPVRSKSTGLSTNVDSLTINSAISAPIGHKYCTNEYSATGGRNVETDEEFKIRLSTFGNLVGKQTKLGLLEAIRLISSKALKIFKYGFSEDGKMTIGVLPCDGSIYTESELLYIENFLSDYVSLSDLNWQGGNVGIKISNVYYRDISIDLSCKFLSGYVEADVRKQIQISMTKYLDYRYWSSNTVVWTDLLQIARSTKGVDYVSDDSFIPHSDILIDSGFLPRIKSFIMRDLSGAILFNSNAAVLPIYYGQ